jgi:phosphinothricin acetyltransferase
MIRQAVATDIGQILEIWNPYIRESVFTFNSQEKDHQDLSLILEQKTQDNMPFLVTTEGERILGFATYSQFRSGDGYRFTVEHTIIISPHAFGRGLGKDLLTAVENIAKNAGVHSIISGVSGENLQGIQFHQAMGYCETARIPEAGRKFDRWFDLVLLQKRF